MKYVICTSSTWQFPMEKWTDKIWKSKLAHYTNPNPIPITNPQSLTLTLTLT